MVKKSENKKNVNLEVALYDINGDVLKKVKLSDEIFAVKVNKSLVSQYVRVYLANQRQGNASTKTRAEITGTTKKMYRQKGTGRARHSTDKVNIFRGGGVTFGPLPRNISLSMNKKQKTQALFSTLTSKVESESVKLIDTSKFGDTPKTKKFAEVLEKITRGKKTLVIMDKVTSNPIVMSLRNIKSVSVTQANTLNAYQVLNSNDILFLDNSIETLETHYLKS